MELIIVQHTERNIAEVHQHLDAFEFRVPAQPASQVDVSTLHDAVESLRADIDMILAARVPKSEAPSTEPVEGSVLATLFGTFEIPQPLPQKMQRGIRFMRRMRLGKGRKSTLRLRLRREP